MSLIKRIFILCIFTTVLSTLVACGPDPRLQELEAAHQQLTTERDDLLTRLSSQETDVQALQQQLSESQSREESLQQARDEAQAQLASSTEALDQQASELAELTEREQAAQSRSLDLERDLAAAEQAQAAAEQAQAAAEQAQAAAREQQLSVEQQLADMQTRAQTLEREQQRYQADILALESSLRESQNRLENGQILLQSQAAQLEDLRTSRDTEVARAGDFEAQLASSEARGQSLARQLSAMENELALCISARDEARASMTSLSDTLESLDSRVATLQAINDSQAERLESLYQERDALAEQLQGGDSAETSSSTE